MTVAMIDKLVDTIPTQQILGIGSKLNHRLVQSCSMFEKGQASVHVFGLWEEKGPPGQKEHVSFCVFSKGK